MIDLFKIYQEKNKIKRSEIMVVFKEQNISKYTGYSIFFLSEKYIKKIYNVLTFLINAINN